MKFRIFTPDMEAGLRNLLPGDVNRDELQRIYETAKRMNRHGPLGKLSIVGFTVVVLVMIVGIRFFVPMTWLGSYAGIGSYVITWMVLVGMFAGYIAWLQPRFRHNFRRASRQHGHEVCVQCGYYLNALGPEIVKCPECGAARVPMPEKANH